MSIAEMLYMFGLLGIDIYLLSPVARSAETSQTILQYGRTLIAHLLKLEQGCVMLEPVYMNYQSVQKLFPN